MFLLMTEDRKAAHKDNEQKKLLQMIKLFQEKLHKYVSRNWRNPTSVDGTRKSQYNRSKKKEANHLWLNKSTMISP